MCQLPRRARRAAVSECALSHSPPVERELGAIEEATTVNGPCGLLHECALLAPNSNVSAGAKAGGARSVPLRFAHQSTAETTIPFPHGGGTGAKDARQLIHLEPWPSCMRRTP
jgi:hypothetical protein